MVTLGLSFNINGAVHSHGINIFDFRRRYQMPNVFDPIKIGPIEVKNRIVASPLMSNTDIDGYVTQNTLD